MFYDEPVHLSFELGPLASAANHEIDLLVSVVEAAELPSVEFVQGSRRRPSRRHTIEISDMNALAHLVLSGTSRYSGTIATAAPGEHVNLRSSNMQPWELD